MKAVFALAAVWLCAGPGFGRSRVDALLEPYQRQIAANPASSLPHYEIALTYFGIGNYQAAALAFRDALAGDLQPRWIEVWSHIHLGMIFEVTSQPERARREYQLALETGDDPQSALAVATAYLIGARKVARTRSPLAGTRVNAAFEVNRSDPEQEDEVMELIREWRSHAAQRGHPVASPAGAEWHGGLSEKPAKDVEPRGFE